MFLYREDATAALYAIPQVSHAWLAWQLADHWGNRRFARPRPRAEVLAAILLHDSGWTDYDAAPVIDGDGRLRTFDRMEPVTHLEIWRRSVLHTAMHSRYAALLVAEHFAGFAAAKSADLLAAGNTSAARHAEAFRAEMERMQASWRETLADDARYERGLDEAGREASRTLLAACDAVSVRLCAGFDVPFEVSAMSAAFTPCGIHVEPVERRTWCARPWPLEGDRVRLQVEARRLPAARFESNEAVREAVAWAPVERLTFTLVRPSAQ